jgi:hypothetical protein
MLFAAVLPNSSHTLITCNLHLTAYKMLVCLPHIPLQEHIYFDKLIITACYWTSVGNCKVIINVIPPVNMGISWAVLWVILMHISSIRYKRILHSTVHRRKRKEKKKRTCLMVQNYSSFDIIARQKIWNNNTFTVKWLNVWLQTYKILIHIFNLSASSFSCITSLNISACNLSLIFYNISSSNSNRSSYSLLLLHQTQTSGTRYSVK